MRDWRWKTLRVAAPLLLAARLVASPPMTPAAQAYILDHATPADPALQAEVVALDARLRAALSIAENLTAAGVLDLRTLRLALVRPDAIDYAASVPKIGILLAWFTQHPLTELDGATRHELGLMIKQSSNEVAAKHSQALGLKPIQVALDSYGFYDATRGGGLWVGKHYGKGTERYGDPVGGHSHAATVRQLLRFYLLLEQGKLVSPEASRAMRDIFASPEIPHREDRFVKGLAGRGLEIRRKAGWWETWSHDTAVVTGGGRHYIIAVMTHHERGTEYLEQFAAAVDELLRRGAN